MAEESQQGTQYKVRTKIQFWTGIFWTGVVLGVAISVIVVTQLHVHSVNEARQAGVAEGEEAGREEGLAVGTHQGKKRGWLQALGRPKPLERLGHYRFHGIKKIHGKLYAVLVLRGEDEPGLYLLDRRQFPLGFPQVGGQLKPIEVAGYYQPVNPPKKLRKMVRLIPSAPDRSIK